MIAGSIGQKSWAKRWVNGRPMAADPNRTREVTMVPSVGCAKYKKALPVMKAITVRTVIRTVPIISNIEARSPRRRRRASARNDQLSAAMRAPRNPASTRTT